MFVEEPQGDGVGPGGIEGQRAEEGQSAGEVTPAQAGGFLMAYPVAAFAAGWLSERGFAVGEGIVGTVAATAEPSNWTVRSSPLSPP